MGWVRASLLRICFLVAAVLFLASPFFLVSRNTHRRRLLRHEEEAAAARHQGESPFTTTTPPPTVSRSTLQSKVGNEKQPTVPMDKAAALPRTPAPPTRSRDAASEILKCVAIGKPATLYHKSCGNIGGWKTDPISEKIFSSTCSVARVSANRLSRSQFLKKYAGDKPVLFFDPTGKRSFSQETPKALLNNLTKESLEEDLSDAFIYNTQDGRYVKTPSWKQPTQHMKFSEFLSSMEQPWSVDKNVMSRTDGDFVIGTSRSRDPPAALAARTEQATYMTSGFMPVVPEERKRLLLLGASGSGAPVHRHETAWSHQYYGLKRWFLFPPDSSLDFADWQFKKQTTLFWFFHTYLKGEQLECVQMPGETMYIPSGWWHSTLNVGQSVSIAQFDMNDPNYQ